MNRIRLVVIGGVAAGTKAASRAKRLNPDLDIILVTEEDDISYAGCGLPYFLGGIIKDRRELVVRSPEEFEEQQEIKVLTGHKVDEINPSLKVLKGTVKANGVVFTLPYDRLIIATGSLAARPKLPGSDMSNIFFLRSVSDAEALRETVRSGSKTAVIIGGGLIGLEAAENLKGHGLEVTILEREPTILGIFDEEVSLWIAQYLRDQGITIETDRNVTGFEGDMKVTGVKTIDCTYPADIVLWATGTRPNSALAAKAGAELGPFGGIRTDAMMRTTINDIWACGDCCETEYSATNEPAWTAMGSVANKMGRTAGTNASDNAPVEKFAGIAKTAIVKLFDIAAGRTGLTEREAKAKSIEYLTCLVPSSDKAHYYPGHKNVYIKLVAEKYSGKLLGAQVWGEGCVDKPLDILATAIHFKGTISDLSDLDLAYAPPFSMAMSSVITAANVMRNKLSGLVDGISSPDLQELMKAGGLTVLDVRTEPEHVIRAIPDSINIPLEELGERYREIPADRTVVTVCRVGRRAYLAALALKHRGFKDVKILDGGTDAYPYEML